MVYRRDARGMRFRKKRDEILDSASKIPYHIPPYGWLLVGIGALMLGSGIYMGSSVFSDPDYKPLDTSVMTDKHLKPIVVADVSTVDDTTETTGQTANSSSVTLNSDLFGSYPRAWYSFMSVYETRDPLGINGQDGGFGIYQATHSELPTLVEGLYALDSSYYSDLGQYVNNPSLYMRSCVKPHKWNKCRSYPAGSQVLAATCAQYVSTPQLTERWYNDCLHVHEATMTAALKKALECTGKTAETIGAGTVATAYSAKVRYSDESLIFAGCTAGMTEDQFIERVNANCYNKGGEKRFKCQVGLAKKLNAGQVDIYGVIKCTGECGTSHGNDANTCWGHLFGKEGY